MSVPFIGREFSFTQPDGSAIAVRGWGDQNYAVFETLDGFTVTRNPATGYWELAQVSADGTALEPAGALNAPRGGLAPRQRVAPGSARARGFEGAQRLLGGRRCDQRRDARRTQQRTMRAMAAAGGPMLAPPQRGTVGDFVGLCLLVDFSDAPATIARDEVERFCNQVGYRGFGNNGSVHDYYLANSIGRCRYSNVVAPYYRASQPRSFYTDRTQPYGQRARQLILEALTHLKASGFDFSTLTPDNGGFVYASNVFYAGNVQNNWSEGLWPHASRLDSAVALAPGISAFDYQITAMGSELALGTFCHENGHMLCDYPDLYDYGGESSGVGAFCLMCAGANIDEKNPPNISAYLKRLSGWANSVTTLASGQQLSLAASSNDFAMFAKDSREYFIVENRHRSGRDAALPGQGLAVWHVDEDGDNSLEQMSPAQHYELSLVQADGAFQLERQRQQVGDIADLFGNGKTRFDDSTAPPSRWWNGTASQLELRDIGAPGPVVSFRVGPADVVQPPQTIKRESRPDRAIPDNQPTGISETLQVDDAIVFAALTVSVDISHSYRGDLQVQLTAPWGDVVVLHPKNSGGSADDLKLSWDATTLPALAAWRGRSAQGAWRLLVQDLAAQDVGRLNRWALAFTAAAPVVGPVDVQEAPGVKIPDNTLAGIERTLAVAGNGRVGRVEVTVDITHPYIGDLRVSLVSGAGTEVVLHDGAGGSADNISATYTAATTSALAALAGQPLAGTWRLRVADRAAQDLGKLNRWRLLVQPA
jgi:M6 family metalloprotease-like protein